MGHLGWALGAALSLGATQATAEGWEHVFYPASGGDVAMCTAGLYDDRPFVLRAYGPVVDFYLADDGLALPPERMMGEVAFVFDDLDIVLQADSGWREDGGLANDLFLTPRGEDLAPLLERLRSGGEMGIVFPDGLTYIIGLDGSSMALFEAFECWSREITGAVEPHARNPFAAAGATERDPFR